MLALQVNAIVQYGHFIAATGLMLSEDSLSSFRGKFRPTRGVAVQVQREAFLESRKARFRSAHGGNTVARDAGGRCVTKVSGWLGCGAGPPLIDADAVPFAVAPHDRQGQRCCACTQASLGHDPDDVLLVRNVAWERLLSCCYLVLRSPSSGLHGLHRTVLPHGSRTQTRRRMRLARRTSSQRPLRVSYPNA